jgi:hypothetical protein
VIAWQSAESRDQLPVLHFFSRRDEDDTAVKLGMNLPSWSRPTSSGMVLPIDAGRFDLRPANERVS